MQIEDKVPSAQTLEQMLLDPKKRTKIIKILLQTMHTLGYTRTADELEKESEVTYVTPQITNICSFLEDGDYMPAIRIVREFHLHQQTQLNVFEDLYDLQLNKLLNLNDLQGALDLVGNTADISANKKDLMYETMVLGHPLITEKEKQERHQRIIQQCGENDIEGNVMNQLLKEYMKLKTTMRMDCDHIMLYPPNRVIATEQLQHNTNVIFIKYNHTGSQFLLITETLNKRELSIWSIKEAAFQLEKKASQENECFNVQCVNWSPSDQYIAICSKKHVLVVDARLELISVIEAGESEVFLGAEWHPISQLLYVGGLFNSVKVYTFEGDLCMTLQPFMRVRQMLFNSETMYALSAVGSRLLKYSLIDEKEEKSFNGVASFMQMSMNHRRILVTSDKIIYVLDEDLNEIFHLSSPDNPRRFLIEGAIYNSWIILLCENFKAYHRQENGDLSHYHWEGKGFFDVSGDMMISGHEQELVLWGQGTGEMSKDQIEEEGEEEEEVDGNQQDSFGTQELQSNSSESQNQMRIMLGMPSDLSDQDQV